MQAMSLDDYMDIGDRTNIGHIRVKMSGTYFSDRVEDTIAWMQEVE